MRAAVRCLRRLGLGLPSVAEQPCRLHAHPAPAPARRGVSRRKGGAIRTQRGPAARVARWRAPMLARSVLVSSHAGGPHSRWGLVGPRTAHTLTALLGLLLSVPAMIFRSDAWRSSEVPVARPRDPGAGSPEAGRVAKPEAPLALSGLCGSVLRAASRSHGGRHSHCWPGSLACPSGDLADRTKVEPFERAGAPLSWLSLRRLAPPPPHLSSLRLSLRYRFPSPFRLSFLHSFFSSPSSGTLSARPPFLFLHAVEKKAAHRDQVHAERERRNNASPAPLVEHDVGSVG